MNPAFPAGGITDPAQAAILGVVVSGILFLNATAEHLTP